jgi:hypothetical protein
MRRTLRTALVTFALAGGSLAVALPAVADDVTVGIGHGGIAFGYSDGYWDREHSWHQWRDEREANEFRRENREHYYERKHEEDRDHGWRDNDRWWHHD